MPCPEDITTGSARPGLEGPWRTVLVFESPDQNDKKRPPKDRSGAAGWLGAAYAAPDCKQFFSMAPWHHGTMSACHHVCHFVSEAFAAGTLVDNPGEDLILLGLPVQGSGGETDTDGTPRSPSRTTVALAAAVLGKFFPWDNSGRTHRDFEQVESSRISSVLPHTEEDTTGQDVLVADRSKGAAPAGLSVGEWDGVTAQIRAEQRAFQEGEEGFLHAVSPRGENLKLAPCSGRDGDVFPPLRPGAGGPPGSEGSSRQNGISVC